MNKLNKFSRAILAIAMMLVVALPTLAHDFEVGGIYYNYLDEAAKTVEVTYKGSSFNSYYEYSGSVIIPSAVTYSGTTYSVTSIGDDAFCDCSLTSVIIPNSVTSIGSAVFYGCSGLTSVTIGNSVTSIDAWAFYKCEGLTSIEIPNSVISIGHSAFSNCTNLTSVTNGNSVVSIDNDAFYNTAWYNNQAEGVIYLGKALYKYKGTMSDNTSINIKVGTISISSDAFNGCTGLTSVTIPNSVTSIGDYAFNNCSTLAELIIEDGKEPLSLGCNYYNSYSGQGKGQFYDCPLEKLYLGRNLSYELGKDYGYSPFYNKSKLKSVTIGSSVTSIGKFAFMSCTGLTKLRIEDGSDILSLSFNDTYKGLFYDCPLEELYLGRNLSYGTNVYSGYSPFYNKSKLTSVTISNSVTSIGSQAFYGCTNLTSVTIPNSVTSIGSSVFYGCSGLTSATIGNSVTSIGSQAFYGCTNLTSVTIPNSVTSIGSYAFYECSGLTAITIPNSVTSIGSSAFSSCTGLTEVNFNAENCTLMGNSDYPVFEGCSNLNTLNIGNEVKSIPSYAFNDCSSLTELIMEDGKEILSLGYNYDSNSSYTGEGLFYDCPLEKLYIGRNLNYESGKRYGYSPFYSKNIKSVTFGSAILSIDENLISPPIKTIWLTNTPPTGYKYAEGIVNYVSNDLYTELIDKTVYPYLSSIFEVDGVMYVPVSPSERTCDALDCTYENNIDSINIGKTVSFKGIAMNVKNINHYTFYRNNYLTDLTIDSLFAGTIGNHAVWGCKNLKGIDIPNLVTEVGANCFEQCDSLKFAIIGNSVPAINDNTFAGCYSLTDITIPKNVASVGNYAFVGCKAMTNVFIADRNTILELGSNGNEPMFSDCPLDSVYIGGNISYSYADSCGYSPFYRNTSLRAVKITDKETEISDNEFYGCTNLKYVSIGNGVESIGNWAFSGCSSLDYFAFGTSMKTIGEEAFSDCTAVTKLYSQASTPPVCGNQALDDINKWTCELYVPGESIPAYQAADQWKEFFFMYDGVEGVEIDNNVIEIARHDIHGRRLNKPTKGINIIKMSNGTTRKEIVK